MSSRSSRFDFKSRGESFVIWLLVFLLCVAVLYLVLHLAIGHSDHACAPTDYVRLSSTGRVEIIDPSDLNWFVGSDRAAPILQAATKANAEIDQQIDRVSTVIGSALSKSRNSQAENFAELRRRVAIGEYAGAQDALRAVTSGLTSRTLQQIGSADLDSVSVALTRLAALKDEQADRIQALRPPFSSSWFWTDPVGSMVEVIFWSLFGVVTYLLVNSAEYLRTGQFKPAERWVTYTKLVYGPILSLVMVLAIMYGYFDLGEYRVRIYTLPLVAFIFGYAARNLVTLFDKLIEKVFGAAGFSVEQGPAKVLADRQKEIEQIMAAATPANLVEFKQQAKQIGGQVLRNLVAHKDASS